MHRYEIKATGRADLAANEKVLDLYTSNLQLEEQLHGVRRQVDNAKAIAEKVCCQSLPAFSMAHSKLDALSFKPGSATGPCAPHLSSSRRPSLDVRGQLVHLTVSFI